MSDNNNNNNSESAAKKRKADELEPSPRGKKLTNDLLSSLDDPDLCDVTLVGSDGGRVPAIRAILSTRSDVLKHLLVGRFKEASEHEVHMDYPSPVLKALVHYCCTDEAPNLAAKLEGNEAELADSARISSILLIAADYYGLDSLKERTFHDITGVIKGVVAQGLHACILLQETSASPSLQEYCERAFFNVRRNPDFLIQWSKGRGVIYLSSENLLKIVEDAELGACAWILFRAIKIWAERGVHEEGLSSEERVEFAKQCCDKLELRMIQASDLLGEISESGLVDQSAIIKALKKQMGGSAIGLYGAELQCVNGIFDEVLVNDTYEPINGGNDEEIAEKTKRFDKNGQFDGTDTTLSILQYSQANGEDAVLLVLLAPPKGAGHIVITGNRESTRAGNFSKIVEDNRVLYKALVRKRYFDHGAANINWKCSRDHPRRSSNPPTTVLGAGLSSKMPISF